MKLIVAGLILMVTSFTQASDLLQTKLKTIDGQETSLASFQGKSVLLVNIATRCGFTGQLDDLEALYQKYKAKGLVVVGLPSNDFGGQTPESEGEVKRFCRLEYGVTFPLMAKMTVKGKAKHPLIQNLLSKAKPSKEIAWNFEKFLLNPAGKVVARYPSATLPQDDKLAKAIEASLKR